MDEPIRGLFQYVNAKTGMSPGDFDHLIKKCEVRTFDKKSRLLSPGDQEMYFNLILKGVVRKYVFVGKQEITLQLSKEGHFIHAELSYFQGLPCQCYIETIEASTLLSLSKKNMDDLFEEVPSYNKLGRLMASEMFVRKMMRNFTHLKHSAAERFLQYNQRHPDMLQRVPQKYIASYLQIKPETFSRLKHLLKNPS